MPNDSVCDCGVVLDLTKNGSLTAISTPNFTIFIPPTSATKMPREENARRRAGGNASGGTAGIAETGSSTSSVSDLQAQQAQQQVHRRNVQARSKDGKRRSAQRRARSAERAESHYTYIDSSGASDVGATQEHAEALYCTIDQQLQPRQQPQQQRKLYAVPSMTSPPPTYDAAIKSWQSAGLPPTYEEYLYHKGQAMFTRSHTPPPPWSDSTHSTPVLSGLLQQQSDQPNSDQIREYLAQLASLQAGAAVESQHYGQLMQQHQQQQQHQQYQQQALRKQARSPRARVMPPRSQSESRAQRIAYEDGAFCMETTAIQSAFENGVAFCSLM